MREIKYGDTLVAVIGNAADIHPGKEFSPNPADPLQYGLFLLGKDEVLQRHVHKVRPRIRAHKTLEFLYIVRGRLEATFYTLEKQEFAQVILQAGDFAMLYDGGHGFKVLDNGTLFIEVKAGPYVNDTIDKEKF